MYDLITNLSTNIRNNNYNKYVWHMYVNTQATYYSENNNIEGLVY